MLRESVCVATHFEVMILLGVPKPRQSYASSSTAAGSDKEIDENYITLAINKAKTAMSGLEMAAALALGQFKFPVNINSSIPSDPGQESCWRLGNCIYKTES